MHYGSHLEEDLIATGITIHLKTQVLLMETERNYSEAQVSLTIFPVHLSEFIFTPKLCYIMLLRL